MKRLCAPLLIAMLLATSHASAEGDAENGKALAKSKACETCHGADGNAGIDPQYPRLAGQYADYIAKALHEYKSDERKNPIMKGFATPLTDQEIQDLAAFYSTLPESKLTDLHGHVEGG